MKKLVFICLCTVFYFLHSSIVCAQITSFQPSAPYYATFFYLWSENPNTVNPISGQQEKWSYWSDRAHTPPQNWFSNFIPDPLPSSFDPAYELYSSSNEQILIWQLQKLKEARIEIAIGSWWGKDHKSDRAFRNIIKNIMPKSTNPYPNLRWALYYEKEGFGDPTEQELIDELNYIKLNYANDPSYLKINGKPVIFVYNAAHSGYDPLQDFQRWKNVRQQTGFYVSLKKDPLSRGANPADIDSWHEYAPASRTGSQAPYYYFVSPGFWLEGSAPRLNRNITEFTNSVKTMVANTNTWKLIQTWNEWGEGSSVEPGEEVIQTQSGIAQINPAATQFKNIYIEILAQNLPPLEISSLTPTAVPPTIAPTAATSDPVVIAVGDIACGPDSTSSACKEWETSEVVRQFNPNALLVLGDNQYEAGQYSYFTGNHAFCRSNPARCYNDTWGRFKAITYPAVGNHEYGTPNATGYFDYFNGVGVQSGRAGDRTKGYYSFDIGSWHFVALNSNCSRVGGCSVGSPQETWLRQDLQSNKNNCTLAYMHHPLYSSGHDGNNTSLINQMMPLWKTLYDNKVDVVLSGHSHNYERFAPQDNLGNKDPNGFRAFVVGTGGRNFTGFWTNSLANSEIKNNTTFGVLALTLHSNSYDWQFLPIQGNTFTDTGKDTCVGLNNLPTPTVTITPTVVTTQCTKKNFGDANCDNLINLADFEIFRKEFTSVTVSKQSDFDSNQKVELIDFEIWRKSFTT